jgi:5-methylcytosine-specific restriction endonuclease McrA
LGLEDRKVGQKLVLRNELTDDIGFERGSFRCRLDEMEADHVDPCHDGGETIATKCQMLCKNCNRRKGKV